MLDGFTDEALMERYQKGDSRSFEVLLTRHRRPVFNFLLRSARSRATAEDLLQEVFMRIIKLVKRSLELFLRSIKLFQRSFELFLRSIKLFQRLYELFFECFNFFVCLSKFPRGTGKHHGENNSERNP